MKRATIDAYILLSVFFIIPLAVFYILGSIDLTWFTTGIGAIVGIVLFLVSVRMSKTQTEVLFVLFDKRYRGILELLDEEMDTDQIVSSLNISTPPERAQLVRDLKELELRRFIKSRKELGRKKFIRNF